MAFAAMAPPVSRWMSQEELGRLATMRAEARAGSSPLAGGWRAGCWR
jgi:4'-phosphopantetheinyl transferase